MAIVTATEFKQNLGKYLMLAKSEDIEIAKNGKVSVKLTSTSPKTEALYHKASSISSIFGVLPASGISLKEARDERLGSKCGF